MRETNSNPRKIFAVGLSGLLVWTNLWASWPTTPDAPSLTNLVQEPYLVLLEQAEELNFSEKELDRFRKDLEKEEKAEKKSLEREEKELKQQVKELRKQLDELNKTRSRDDSEMTLKRNELHCQILPLEEAQNAKKAAREHGLPVTYDNKQAKVDLIEKWPARKAEIVLALERGDARKRRFGDVEDIGIRVLKEGQEKDIKTGEEAIREMKASGMMPPELEDAALTGYIQQLAKKIADHSDLQVPLRVTVLNSDEINAFAMPGGFLFVNTGLIAQAETESELAGVLAPRNRPCDRAPWSPADEKGQHLQHPLPGCTGSGHGFYWRCCRGGHLLCPAVRLFRPGYGLESEHAGSESRLLRKRQISWGPNTPGTPATIRKALSVSSIKWPAKKAMSNQPASSEPIPPSSSAS